MLCKPSLDNESTGQDCSVSLLLPRTSGAFSSQGKKREGFPQGWWGQGGLRLTRKRPAHTTAKHLGAESRATSKKLLMEGSEELGEDLVLPVQGGDSPGGRSWPSLGTLCGGPWPPRRPRNCPPRTWCMNLSPFVFSSTCLGDTCFSPDHFFLRRRG